MGLFQQGLPCSTRGTEPLSALCAWFVKCLGTTVLFFFFFLGRKVRARKACEHSLRCDCEQMEWFSWKKNKNKTISKSCQSGFLVYICQWNIPRIAFFIELKSQCPIFSTQNYIFPSKPTSQEQLLHLHLRTDTKRRANVPINAPHIFWTPHKMKTLCTVTFRQINNWNKYACASTTSIRHSCCFFGKLWKRLFPDQVIAQYYKQHPWPAGQYCGNYVWVAFESLYSTVFLEKV